MEKPKGVHEDRWRWLEEQSRRFAATRDQEGRRLCSYCRTPVAPPKIRWCSKACVEKYLSETDWKVIRITIRDRDQHRCQRCRTDLRELERLTVASNEVFADIQQADAWLRAAGFNPYSSLWEVNHIKPKAEGGTDEHANLELLCVPCHKAETREQHQRWARARRGQPALIPEAEYRAWAEGTFAPDLHGRKGTVPEPA